MKLVKVKGTPFLVRCKGCNNLAKAGDGHDIIADLHGEAWVAYYHARPSCMPSPEKYHWVEGCTNITIAKEKILKDIR